MDTESRARVTVVIPTYNEAGNIEPLIRAIFEQPIQGGLEILVVDDNSPDGTGQRVSALAETEPRLFLLSRSGKQGLGPAYIAGFRWALERGSEIIAQMDADFSHDPADLARLIGLARSADLVIGSRYVAEGRLDRSWGLARKALSWWANRIWARTILGLPVNDVTAGFRVWKAAALRKIGLERVKANGYFFQIETAYLSAKAGCKIIEEPIYFKSRTQGNSKMDFKLQLEAAIGVFFLRRRHKKFTGK